MRKLLWWTGVIGIGLLLTLTACSQNENGGTDGTVHETEEPKLEQEEQDPKENEERDEEQDKEQEGDSSQPAITAAELEGGVVVGSSAEEITALLGLEYTEVLAALTGEPTWRYDIGAQEGYVFESSSDTPDVSGLKESKLTLQVFVYFNDEESVTGYSAYESKPGDESVDVYHLMEDGSRISEKID